MLCEYVQALTKSSQIGKLSNQAAKFQRSVVKCTCLTNIVRVMFCTLKYYISCEIIVDNFDDYKLFLIWQLLNQLFDNRKHKRCSLKVFEFFVITLSKTSFSATLQSTCHHKFLYKFLHPLHCLLRKFDRTAPDPPGFLFFN